MQRPDAVSVSPRRRWAPDDTDHDAYGEDEAVAADAALRGHDDAPFRRRQRFHESGRAAGRKRGEGDEARPSVRKTAHLTDDRGVVVGLAAVGLEDLGAGVGIVVGIG